jgi:hypothetical protein
MDGINILNQKNPDNPVNPVQMNVSYKLHGIGIKLREHGVCKRSNLILFVLVLVNQNFIGTRDEYEDDDEDEVCTL